MIEAFPKANYQREIPQEQSGALVWLKRLHLQLDAETFANDAVYLAGGCIRDSVHGVLYKDVDVVILCDGGNWFSDDIESYIERYCRKVGLTVKADYIGYGEDYGLRGLVRVCSTEHNATGMKVDLLFYGCNNVQEVLDGFDFNINQYYLGTDWREGRVVSRLMYSSNVGPEQKLAQVRTTEEGTLRWADRLSRMQQKAREFGWEVL